MYNLRIGIGGEVGIPKDRAVVEFGLLPSREQRTPSRPGGPQDLQMNHPCTERDEPHAGLTH